MPEAQPAGKPADKARLFGTSGIRGVFGKTVTTELATALGKAIGSCGYRSVIVGMDTRQSGEVLKRGLSAGLLEKSATVTDIGIVPTPVLSYATRKLGADCGVMITASHNPAQYNGFKLWDSEGKAFDRDEEMAVERAIEKTSEKTTERGTASHSSPAGKATSGVKRIDISSEYCREVRSLFRLEGTLRVLIDPGNGAAYSISPQLLRALGYDLVAINAEADGTFPNRNPEPNEKNLAETARIAKNKGCAIGFCHDGDADRVMVIDDKGRVVHFDKFLAYLCKKTAETGNKTIVTTVDASMLLEDVLPDCDIIRTRVGDVFVAKACKQHRAAFGGEPSGSYIFPEFGLWPDGIYAILKTLSFLEKERRPLSEILDEMKEYPFTRLKVPCADEKKDRAMAALQALVPEHAALTTVDGIRMDFGDSMVLIRPSGTEPLLRINVEAREVKKLKKLEAEWKAKAEKAIRQA